MASKASDFKKNPTNADIFNEVKRVGGIQVEQGRDIKILMDWKMASEAGKAAVDEYRRQENESNKNNKSEGLNKDIIKALLIALGVIVTLAGVIAASKGAGG